MINANDGFNFDKAVEIDSKLKTGKGDVIMSTAKELIEKGKQEGWQKGRQEGIQKGRQKGIQLGIQEGVQLGRQLVINNMLEKGYTLDEIQKVTGATKAQIKELQEKADQAKVEEEDLEKLRKVSQQLKEKPNPTKVMGEDLEKSKNNTLKL